MKGLIGKINSERILHFHNKKGCIQVKEKKIVSLISVI